MFKLNDWNEKESFSVSKIAQNVISTACGSDVVASACGGDINTACGSDITTACGSDRF